MALLAVSDVGIAFGGLKAVDGVSFAVEAREIFAIIGPNGAGKTTLFNLVSRIYEPSNGRIALEGRDITHIAPHDVVRAGIARTFQNIALFDNATVLDNLMLGRFRHGRAGLWRQALFTPFVRREKLADRRKVEEVIDFLEIGKYRDVLVGGLPYGVRKIVELGRALASEPRLLLLDEPSSGLNVEETSDMVFWIQDIRDDLNMTVLMIEHDMSLVSAVSDRVLAMNSGRMLALGAPTEVQRDPAVAAAYLGG
ncbi:MAG: ABC transporter ATP-binding protein [Alphaproteobacteria bacterium]